MCSPHDGHTISAPVRLRMRGPVPYRGGVGVIGLPGSCAPGGGSLRVGSLPGLLKPENFLVSVMRDRRTARCHLRPGC